MISSFIMVMKNGKKVFVAMSGGVDSSVSAALLKKEGYDVTGVFMSVWQPDFLPRAELRGLDCQSDDRREAMRVAAHLKIPFLTFDFEKEYKNEVVEYMVREYKEGRTPNPDVMCNRHIKFGIFLKKAIEMGADMIATGHYARIRATFDKKHLTVDKKTKTQSQRSHVKGHMSLLAGVDKSKDQSYFLWTLTQKELRHVIFPVGDYLKTEVRKLAKKFGLPNAERKESQGLCFVGEFKMRDFLEHFIPKKRGDVLNENGETIGFHDGAFYYTLGQRHGFTIVKKGPNDPPLYIVSKDIGANTITIAPKSTSGAKEGADAVRDAVIKDVNFISGKAPDPQKTYHARIRYRQPLQEARIMKYELMTKKTQGVQKKDGEFVIHNSKFIIRFREPQKAVTPGQSIVLYDPSTGSTVLTTRKLGTSGEECLGGGIISTTGSIK